MSGLYLVDAMALAYRSFFALMRTGMRSPDGRPTTAVHGFAQALLRVVETRSPTHMAIARDLPGPTFRHDDYPLYKAQRQPMPDDLRAQIPLVEELAASCGLPLVSKERHEADDVMATYTRLAKAEGIPVFLMTRDKDLMQLVGDGVRLYDPGRGSERPEEIDSDWVRAKFGVGPAQVRDWLALVGDASDNVPGVPKVGEKTATELLLQYPDIETIYANLDTIGEKKKAVRKNLEEGRESMRLSRHLVTLVDNLDLPSVSSLEFKGLDIPRMRQFMSDLGMRTLVAQLDKLAGGAPARASHPDTQGLDLFSQAGEDPAVAAPEAKPAANLQILSDESDVSFCTGILRSVEKVALAPWLSETGALLGMGLSWSEGIGRFLPTPDGVLPDALRSLLSDTSRRWIAHDSKLLRRTLGAHGLEVAGVVEDVQLAAYLMAPGDRALAMERIAQARATRVLRSREDILGGARNRRKAADIPQEELCAHAAGAAEAMFISWEKLFALLAKESLDGIYRDLELPLSAILRRMEDQGICLDKDLFASLSQELTTTIADLEKRCQELAGKEFNVGSPRQLAEILFDHLGLKAGRKTETGQRSTDSDTLEALKAEHALPGLVLEHREVTKLLGTYVEPLPLLADSQDRVHTTFHQTVAATGRLSSMDPNLQNIPIRGELGRRIRGGFVASPGHVLISADYSQIELRLLAHLSGDDVLREVYRAGEDVHARTAARVHGVAPADVTADQRRAAKVVNFGVVYGMGPHALAQQTGLPYAEAKRFIEGYFAAYPRVKPYMEEVLEAARCDGYVSTLLGRKRWIREINDNNRVFRERAEREAVNTPVQGSAADLVKLAMLAVDASIREGLPARQLLQVHDELVLECPTESAQAVAAEVKRRMEGAMELSIPLVVETGIGPNWGAAH